MMAADAGIALLIVALAVGIITARSTFAAVAGFMDCASGLLMPSRVSVA